MESLSRWLSGLFALLTGATTATGTQTDAANVSAAGPSVGAGEGNYTRSVLLRNSRQAGKGWTVVAHGSHSSHSSHASHASHYSSSGGGGTPTPPSNAKPAPPPPNTGSPPATANPAPPNDAAGNEVAKLIMRVQLSLNARGYCNCAVDGKMGTALHEALKKFQGDNSLPATGLLDTETLKRLGIEF